MNKYGENKKEDLTKPIPGLINVTFDYFFPLNTIPPIDYPVMLPSLEVGVVRIEHREGMLTIDKGYKPTEKKEKKLIHRRKHKGNIKVQYNGGAWNYVDTDLNGSMKFTKLFTRVQIIFPVADLRANPAEKNNREYIEKSTKSFFNKFLMSYMYGVGDFVVRLYEREESDWPVIKWLRSYDYTEENKERLKKNKRKI